MADINNSNQDCGCSDGCCTPQKKGNNLWKILVFIVIILAAGAIITVKLVNKQEVTTEKCCDNPENSNCCPQTKTE
jgi:flagellar basal body-associated protein FliL